MARFIILFLVFGITIYALIDCARKDDSEIKILPKWGWLLVIILIGPQALAIGPIAYLIAGRNRNNGWRKPKRRILPPDDDPDFLRKI